MSLVPWKLITNLFIHIPIYLAHLGWLYSAPVHHCDQQFINCVNSAHLEFSRKKGEKMII